MFTRTGLLTSDRHERILGLGKQALTPTYRYERIMAAVRDGMRAYALSHLTPRDTMKNKRALVSFQVGMTTQITQRLIEMAAADGEIVGEIVPFATIEWAFARFEISGSRPRMTRFDLVAYYVGVEAGKRVDLRTS
jgi:hypothetical protein